MISLRCRQRWRLSREGQADVRTKWQLPELPFVRRAIVCLPEGGMGLPSELGGAVAFATTQPAIYRSGPTLQVVGELTTAL